MVEANKKKAQTNVKKTTTTTTKAASTAGRGRGTKAAATATRGTTRPTPGAAGRGRGAAATGSKMVGSTRDDYECPVCLELCAQPVLTPCKHFMCFQCHKRCVEMDMTCPMCRSHFDRHFVPQVDADLQQEIAEKMGSLFEDRKQELEEAGDWLGLKRLVKFSFGNTHEDVQNPKQSKTNAGAKNTHRWCMFVVLNGSNKETGKFIKQVTYHLHPTFKPHKIVVKDPPFLLSRVGWGLFDVEMDLEFQPSTGMGTKRLTHLLSFDNAGKTQSIFIEVDQEADDNDTRTVATGLAAKFDQLNVNEEEKKE